MTNSMPNSKDVLKAVSSFYVNNHFNDTDDIDARRRRLNSSNLIKSIYPDLHDYLTKSTNSKVLEAGCGTGWLTYLFVRYYKLHITAIDQSEYALSEANKLVNIDQHKRLFMHLDLFNLPIIDTFDCIISLGVLHHTHDTFEALTKLRKHLKPGGSIYLGLYHKPSRDIFFNYTGVDSPSGPSLEKFSELFKLNKDDKHLKTWYNDQCLHVHETQHTLLEIYKYASQNSLTIESTSLNKFKPLKNVDESDCISMDKEYAFYVKKMIENEKRFLPGFFTVKLTGNK